MTDSLDGQATSSSSSVVTPLPTKTTPEDLLSLYETEAAESSADISKEAARQAKVQQEVPKKILVDKLVKNLEKQEEQAGASPQPSVGAEEQDEEEGGGEEAIEEGEASSQESSVKTFKAKHGDADIEIPEEAVIPVKVNNKDVALKVKDAVAAYVRQDEFNRSMDRRVGAVSQKERRFQQELDQIKEKAETVVKMASQGDFIPGVRVLAKMAGITSESDVVELERAMLDNLEGLRKVWTEMSPEQRAAYMANRKAEEAQKELEAMRVKNEKAETETQFISRLKSVITSAGLDDQMFWGRFEELINVAVGEGKLFSDPRQIQPEDVINYHRQVEAVKKVDKALSKINPELMEQPIADEVIKLVSGHDEFTSEDVEQIVRQALEAPSKTVENLNRKVEQANSKGLRSQLKQVSSTKKAKDSELDEEMYQHFFGRRQISSRSR